MTGGEPLPPGSCRLESLPYHETCRTHPSAPPACGLLVSDRPDRGRQDAGRRGIGPADRGRDRLARLDGSVSRHGHRHRQAQCRRSPPRAASPARPGAADARITASANISTAAHQQITDIRARGREVLFVGGTPLYLKSLLRGVYRRAASRLGVPPADRSGTANPVAGCAARAVAGDRPAAGRQAASQRQAADHPRPGGLSPDRPASQPPANPVRRGPPRGAVQGVRAHPGRATSCTAASTPASMRCSPPAWSRKSAGCWPATAPSAARRCRRLGIGR